MIYFFQPKRHRPFGSKPTHIMLGIEFPPTTWCYLILQANSHTKVATSTRKSAAIIELITVRVCAFLRACVRECARAGGRAGGRGRGRKWAWAWPCVCNDNTVYDNATQCVRAHVCKVPTDIPTPHTIITGFLFFSQIECVFVFVRPRFTCFAVNFDQNRHWPTLTPAPQHASRALLELTRQEVRRLLSNLNSFGGASKCQ
jgi:hypothetical protein